MIQVIGQCVEAANEEAARQLFDVLETLLILVRQGDGAAALHFNTPCRRRLYLVGTFRNWFSSS